MQEQHTKGNPPIPNTNINRFNLIVRHRLSSTTGNIHAALEVAVDIHDAPVILPVFAGGVVNDLPRLIESLEPVSAMSATRFLIRHIKCKHTRNIACHSKARDTPIH